jgi:hypothetical protein
MGTGKMALAMRRLSGRAFEGLASIIDGSIGGFSSGTFRKSEVACCNETSCLSTSDWYQSEAAFFGLFAT